MTASFADSAIEDAAFECFGAIRYPPDKQETTKNTLQQQVEPLSDY